MTRYLTLLMTLALLVVGAATQAQLPPIESATSDEHGRFVVNGTPFFPILLYDVPTDPESLRKFHEHGFNMVTVSKAEEAEAARAAGLYAAAHGRKIEKFDSLLLGIGMDSPVLNLKPPLLDNLKLDLEKARAAIPGRPIMHAIGYWLNEPAGVVAGTLPPPEKYEEVVQTIEVAAPYLYPVPYQPIRSVGDAVGRAYAASTGKEPVLPILQIFKWTAEDRFPTAAELRCMVYLSLIHGAHGIGFYSYNHVTGKKGVTFEQDQPELWASLKPLNAEIAKVGPELMDGAPDPAVRLKETDSGVEMRAVKGAGGSLAVLVNPSDKPCEAMLQTGSKVEPVKLDAYGIVLQRSRP